MHIKNKFLNARVHFYLNDENVVYSKGKKIFFKSSEKKIILDFSNFFEKWFCKFRLLSRLLRIDRFNVIRLSSEKYMIINKGKLYMIINGLIYYKFKFPFTKYVHVNTISVNKNSIAIGEYGNSKGKHDVGVFFSKDGGNNWTRISLFKKKEVKEILAVYFDDLSTNYWVFTGDKINESKVVIFSQDWTYVKTVGENNLKFRSISAFFFKNHVIWYMNNPFGESYVVKFLRENGKIIIGQKLPGPAWYSISLGDKYYLSIASEKSIHQNEVFLLSSKNAEKWKTEKIFIKDCFPKNLFLFGLINFAQLDLESNLVACYCESVNDYDGKTFFLDYERD
tara:strand:+ start:734 stop:1744 length:1011 start_codon:yes stop_codon:yes gene_type:complete